jgi:hypothetical protein
LEVLNQLEKDRGANPSPSPELPSPVPDKPRYHTDKIAGKTTKRRTPKNG